MTHAHGTLARYKQDGCRCPACRKASADYMRYRHRMMAYGRWQPHVDAAGTRRRVEALVWNGWSLRRLAVRLGWARPVLQHKMGSAHVTAASAAKVRALYAELWDQAPPEGTKDEKRAAAMARRYARERGFVPPMAWDDETIDDPAAVPVPGWERGEQYEPPALAEEVRDLAGIEGLGLSSAQLAERLGVSRSTVDKALAGAGERAA